MKQLFIFIFIFLSLENVLAFKLQNGDLIFQQPCNNEGLGNAIKNVTQSQANYQFTHVGMVYEQDGEVFVLEATLPEVKLTPLDDYLYPNGEMSCNPKSVAYRLAEEYLPCIPMALQEGLKLIGKEYDHGFVLNNDKYYCSELIYEILLKANNDIAVFPLNTMTFKKKDTHETDDGWKTHFEKWDLPIPEGEPGINPGTMSCSDVVVFLGEI